MLAKMNNKGQIQIPASIRLQFNMQTWQSHDVEVIGHKIIITPAPDADKIRKQLKQNLYKQGYTDEKLKEMVNENTY